MHFYFFWIFNIEDKWTDNLKSHLRNHWSKNKLSRTIGLFSKQKVQEWKFVDVEVKIDITIGSHRPVWFLGDTRDLFLSQSAHIEEGGEEKSEILKNGDWG